MSAEEIKARINLLTDTEREVLRVVFEHPDLSDKSLSKDRRVGLHYLDHSSSTIRNIKAEAFACMRPFTQDQFAPYILGTVVEEPEPEPIPEPEPEEVPEPDPDPEEEPQEQTEEEPTPIPTIIEGVSDLPPQPPIRDQRHHTLPILIGTILLGLLGIAIWQFIGRQNLQQRIDNIIPEVVEVPVVTEVPVTVVVTQQVEREVTRVVEMIQTVPVEVTSLVAAVTEVPVTVEVTSAPPTTTPTPEATPFPPDFIISEDFDDLEIDPLLNPSGDYSIVNGLLHGPFTFKVGDESWRNYTITFFVSGSVQYDWRLRVRENDTSYLEYHEDGGGGGWSYVSGSSSGSIPDSNPVWVGDVEVIVEDGRIMHVERGRIVFANTYSDNGGISFTMNGHSTFDNLVITRND